MPVDHLLPTTALAQTVPCVRPKGFEQAIRRCPLLMRLDSDERNSQETLEHLYGSGLVLEAEDSPGGVRGERTLKDTQGLERQTLISTEQAVAPTHCCLEGSVNVPIQPVVDEEGESMRQEFRDLGRRKGVAMSRCEFQCERHPIQLAADGRHGISGICEQIYM